MTAPDGILDGGWNYFMLRKTIRYMIVIVGLICISAVSLIKVYQYHQKVKAYEQNMLHQQNVISEQNNELSELKDEIAALNVDSIFELHMVDAFDSNFELDIDNKHIMTAENVAVRAIPDDRAVANRTLTYQMVTVRAAVYGPGGEKWALVSFVELDAISDNIGWVKVSELMEYGEDNYHLLTYPVELKEGTTDLQTGKKAHMDHFKITQIGDDCVSVVSEGGQGYEVAPQAVVYPAFEKE